MHFKSRNILKILPTPQGLILHNLMTYLEWNETRLKVTKIGNKLRTFGCREGLVSLFVICQHVGMNGLGPNLKFYNCWSIV